MANFFSNLASAFGMGKDKGLGDNPATAMYKGLLDIDQGKKYGKTLEERLAGIGIGYDPTFLSGATAPYAAARREGVTRYEMPAISSQASARGLGRSTIPVNITAQKQQEAERDIEQRVADIGLKNEAQKRTEIADALARYGQFAGDIVGGENTKAEAVNREFNRQQGYKENSAAQGRQGALNLVSGAGSVLESGINPFQGLTDYFSNTASKIPSATRETMMQDILSKYGLGGTPAYLENTGGSYKPKYNVNLTY